MNDTIIFFTSDNGPHQGLERSDIRFFIAYQQYVCIFFILIYLY